MKDEAFVTAVDKGGKFLDKIEWLEAENARLLDEIYRLKQFVINKQYAARLEAETVERLEAQAAAMREALNGANELSDWKSNEIERLKAQAAAMRDNDEHALSAWADASHALLERLRNVEAEAAAMREALEAVRWLEDDENGVIYCPWCAVSPGERHLSDCQGENALADDAGRALLAEVATMRVALKEIKEEAEDDFDRDVILTACESGLRGSAPREGR